MKPYIDYTLLDEKAPLEKYMELCQTAKLHSDLVRSVCVPPNLTILELCARETADSKIFVCAVNDFPFGDGGIRRKNKEVILAYTAGVREIDTVINLPALKRGYVAAALEEMEKFMAVAPKDLRVKVILETGHKWYDEALLKKVSVKLASFGVFALKTSTGLKDVDTPAGFLPEISLAEKIRHARLMHKAAPDVFIKIAGGIKTAKDTQRILSAIHSKKVIIGTSSPVWNPE
ncbi:MAG: hypothetical protein HZC14_00055 [Candidatus Niyogibacteria bacterium]|nr:hypothetical protein [Candidatus Niyogibacteria bacterium]